MSGQTAIRTDGKVHELTKMQRIICDGHRRWLEGCTEVARAALRGIAALNEE